MTNGNTHVRASGCPTVLPNSTFRVSQFLADKKTVLFEEKGSRVIVLRRILV